MEPHRASNLQPASDLAHSAFTLTPGIDYIEIGIGLIERNSAGLLKVSQSGGVLRLPTDQLRFGESLEEGCARVGAGRPGFKFLRLVENLARGRHQALCIYERHSESRQGEWSSIKEIEQHGDDLSRAVLTALNRTGTPPQSWNGAPSRYDELAGFKYIGLGVGAIVTNGENKVLLGLRGPAVRQEPGRWDFPGGGVEIGQLTHEAISREVFEEHGVPVVVERFLDLFDHRSPADQSHWISASYLCSTTATTAEPLEKGIGKCDAARFFTLEELDNLPLTICAARHREQVKALLAARQAQSNAYRRYS